MKTPWPIRAMLTFRIAMWMIGCVAEAGEPFSRGRTAQPRLPNCQPCWTAPVTYGGFYGPPVTPYPNVGYMQPTAIDKANRQPVFVPPVPVYYVQPYPYYPFVR